MKTMWSCIVLVLLTWNAVNVKGDVFVSTGGSDTAGCGAEASPCLTLSAAVVNCPTAIYIAAGVFSGPENSELVLTHACEFVGNGSTNTVIDLSNSAFFVDADILSETFLIRGIAFTNAANITNSVIAVRGNSSDGISAQVSISDVVFKNNIITSGASLLSISNTTGAQIKDSSFTNNFGAVHMNDSGYFLWSNIDFANSMGGLVITSVGIVRLLSSEFVNVANGGYNGKQLPGQFPFINALAPVSITGNNTDVTVSSCSFRDNTYFGLAGALAAYIKGRITVLNTAFTNNTQTSQASFNAYLLASSGALSITPPFMAYTSTVYLPDISVNVENSTFSKNTNYMYAWGSALSVVGAAGFVSDSTFDGNAGTVAKVIYPMAFHVRGCTFKESVPSPAPIDGFPSALLKIGTTLNFPNGTYIASVADSNFMVEEALQNLDYYALWIDVEFGPYLNVSVGNSSLTRMNGKTTKDAILVEGGVQYIYWDLSVATVTIAASVIVPDITCVNAGGIINLAEGASIGQGIDCNRNQNSNCTWTGAAMCAKCTPSACPQASTTQQSTTQSSSQATGDASGQATGQASGQPTGQASGQPTGQASGQTTQTTGGSPQVTSMALSVTPTMWLILASLFLILKL